MKVLTLISAAILFAPFSQASAGDKLPHYTYGESVTVEGTVEQRIYPGPPNFENIEKGDAKQVVFLLVLATPIDVIGTKETDAPEAKTEKDVEIIQLVSSKGDDHIGRYDGKAVTASGKFFHQGTAQQRTAVLLDVQTIEALDAKK